VGADVIVMKHQIQIIAAMIGLAGFGGGCNSGFPDAVRSGDGEILRVELLREIGNDPDLTEEQKTQIFNDLGLTDPDLIEFLINS